jgi:HPt (histidine-containing phosphotransfer) domain-containing protein
VPELLDSARLEELLADFDRAELSDIVDLFEETGAEQLRDIDSALLRRDREEVAVAAHALKGGALGLGATALADAAAELEVLARADRPIDAPAQAVHERWQPTITALRDAVG